MSILHRISWMAAAAVLVTGQVSAASAAPRLLGNYALTLTELCQAHLHVGKNAQQLVNSVITLGGGGRISMTLGTIVFQANGRASFSRRVVAGSAVRVDNLGGEAMHTLASTGSNLPFTVGATSVTVSGDVYFAVFQETDALGVAHRVELLRQSGDCAERGTLYSPR